MGWFTTHLNYQLLFLVLSDRSRRLVPTMDRMSLYAFHLIPLLEKMLVKIREDQEHKVIVIVPSWPRRS